MPSALNRATHLRTVRGQTPAARPAASGVCPLRTAFTKSLSTKWRQTGILVDVHPVLLRGLAVASQLQLPRSGPDGQPIESSQLERIFTEPDASGLRANDALSDELLPWRAKAFAFVL